MDTIGLKIKGMSYGSCTSLATHALQRAPGMDAVDVDLVRGIARINGNAQAMPAMLAALAVAGYEAESLSTGAGARTEHAHRGDVPTDTAHKSGGCYH